MGQSPPVAVHSRAIRVEEPSNNIEVGLSELKIAMGWETVQFGHAKVGNTIFDAILFLKNVKRGPQNLLKSVVMSQIHICYFRSTACLSTNIYRKIVHI